MMAGSSVKSDGVRRLRLNVSAMLSNEVVSKFLVVVDEEAGMDQLIGKVQQTLKRNGIMSTLERVQNSFQAILPADEFLGDVCRDGEEIYVILRGEDGVLLQDRPSPRRQAAAAPPLPPAPPAGRAAPPPMPPDAAAGGNASGISLLAAPSGPHTFGVIGQGGNSQVLPVRAMVTLPPQVQDEDGSDSEDDSDCDEDRPPMAPIEDYPPMPIMPWKAAPGSERIPGPSEEFEHERMPYETMVVDHPHDPVQLKSYDNDWLVEGLTPRLREFILSRFQSDLITEPKYVPSIGKFVGAKFLQASGSFVSVFMRPQTAISSDPNATMPVHYNIAKADLFSFQRKCESQIDALQKHQELFRGSLRALKALIVKGMAETDVVQTMLPHEYKAFQEVEGVMLEAERPILPITNRCQHPVIIVDTSGAVGQHLMYVKAALKRVLHSHMSGKASFQLIRFTASTGEPRLWAQEMMRPTEAALQAAEDWIEALVPANRSHLVNSVRFALAHQDCDEIYIISSATADSRSAQHEAVLTSLRNANAREVAINTIGVEPEPEAEVLLRNISESNHGDFTLKSFRNQGIGKPNAIPSADSRWTSWRTNLVNEKSKQVTDDFKKQSMAIGSQIKIIEVMNREEAKKEAAWHEEWRCAQRLLAAQKDPRQAAPDRDMVKELEARTSRTLSARVGGGFLYKSDEVNIGMEKLFEHKSAVPWTQHSETLAVGPKVPLPDAGLARMAKLPPGPDQLPLSQAQEAERCYTGRSAASRGSTQATQKRLSSGAGSNPWTSQFERTHRPVARKAGGGGGRTGRGASNSARRSTSADRAAGTRPRSASPSRNTGSRVRSKTPPAQVERRRQPQQAGYQQRRREEQGPAPPPPPPPPPPEPPMPQHPVLERRWSF
eukprot:TRINITY_DN22386_c1_g1_i1.p1 TRINITY_DN22386_c1_g1~~TRINITY_DN22386_c1_g1_i1.p1  ORF type:complete len:891 (+),score=167.29 TRINITY_DN22386_c1_g1_i1:101-2773(+)